MSHDEVLTWLEAKAYELRGYFRRQGLRDPDDAIQDTFLLFFETLRFKVVEEQEREHILFGMAKQTAHRHRRKQSRLIPSEILEKDKPVTLAGARVKNTTFELAKPEPRPEPPKSRESINKLLALEHSAGATISFLAGKYKLKPIEVVRAVHEARSSCKTPCCENDEC